MKKLFFFLCAATTILTMLAACGNNKNKVVKKAGTTDSITKASGYAMRKVKVENGIREVHFGFPVSKDSVPEGLIEYDLARLMSLKYKEDADKVTVRGEQRPDAANIYFSLVRLQEFMARIEASFPDESCRPNLGVRIYYIRYPQNMDMPGLEGLSPTVANHHSIMFVPTYTNEQGQTVDFNLDEIGDPCQPTPYWRTSEASKKKKNILFSGLRNARTNRAVDGRMGVMQRTVNHGGLTPPPDDEPGTFPTPAGPSAAATGTMHTNSTLPVNANRINN
jgi:hypothetical protein